MYMYILISKKIAEFFFSFTTEKTKNDFRYLDVNHQDQILF
jgi:hypothetical protein